jgi:CheY-like chemotaxis protein
MVKSDINQIMIIEDNTIHYNHLARWIKGVYPDIIIDRAENEYEAIELLESNKSQGDVYHYNCIVTDVILGSDAEFGGINFLEYIIQNNIDYVKDKVIVVTAHEGMSYRDKFGYESKNIFDKVRELGAYDCISKNLIGKNYFDEVINSMSCIYGDKSDNNIVSLFPRYSPNDRSEKLLKMLEENNSAFMQAIQKRIKEVFLSLKDEKNTLSYSSGFSIGMYLQLSSSITASISYPIYTKKSHA